MSNVTHILNAIEQGDKQATNDLLPLVYEELRRLAAQNISNEMPGHTLQATALVHEAYIRLVEAQSPNWNSSGHFFKAAAEAMRRILVDKARHKQSLKAGGAYHRVDMEMNESYLPALVLADDGTTADLLALNEALEKLDKKDPRNAELVKLRYFAGLSLEQVAQVQGITRRTATRWWTYARAWLYREITGENHSGP